MSIDFFSSTSTLLASQYQTQNFLAIIKAICGIASSTSIGTAQGVYSYMTGLVQSKNLATAIGAQLDGIGEIIGLKRAGGESDASYREALQKQASISTSSGTYDQLIRVASSLCTPIGQDDAYVVLFEVFPLTLLMTIYQYGQNIPAGISASVNAACAAPVDVVVCATGGFVDIFYFNGSLSTNTLTLNGGILLLNGLQLELTFAEGSNDSRSGFGYGSLVGIA